MTTAVSQITKSWTNPYASTMTLQNNGGILHGHYASTAGASGVYQVLGYIDPQAGAVTHGSPGVPVGLMLNWRSISQGSQPDPSWNYVSGMGGLLIADEAGDTVINVNHALIASNPLPGAVSEAGFYVDRLEYKQAQTGAAPAAPAPCPLDQQPETFAAPSALVYVDEQDPTTKLTLLGKPDSPAFWAGFEWGNNAAALIGTCNAHYTSAIGPYQSLAFCGTVMPGVALSLSGWLNHTDNTVTLQSYWVGPQSWQLRFFQSRGRSMVMKAQ